MGSPYDNPTHRAGTRVPFLPAPSERAMLRVNSTWLDTTVQRAKARPALVTPGRGCRLHLVIVLVPKNATSDSSTLLLSFFPLNTTKTNMTLELVTKLPCRRPP